MMLDLLLIAVAVLLAWYTTGRVRRYAILSSLLDRPNDRSSHSAPTPRGGGVGIVLSFGALLGIGAAAGRAHPSLALALLGGAFPIALIGWYDDRHHLPARWRFLAHVAAASWAIWCLPSLPPIPTPGGDLDLHWIGAFFGCLLAVWMVNLYNFMDGIDGIAGVQCVTVALGGALVGGLAVSWASASQPLLFAAAVLGFLIWNFPPAKIFMGDVGSGFIGMVLATLALWSAAQEPPLLWSWLILTAAFMTDATVTLIRRVLRGEKFYLAHRSHAYQYASRLYKSHKVVTLAFGAINVFWLFPWALAVALGWIDGVLALVIAYAPLVLLAFHYKAGDRAAQGDLA